MEKVHPSTKGIRAIAVYEAVKGIIGLIAGFGLLSLINRDVVAFAEDLVGFLHLNSEGRLAQRIVKTFTNLSPSNIELLFFLLLLYAIVRFIEAYGLWRLRTWAEWFAIISGSVYIPIEIYKIYEEPSFIHIGILLINIGMVLYLIYYRREQAHLKNEPAI